MKEYSAIVDVQRKVIQVERFKIFVHTVAKDESDALNQCIHIAQREANKPLTRRAYNLHTIEREVVPNSVSLQIGKVEHVDYVFNQHVELAGDASDET